MNSKRRILAGGLIIVLYGSVCALAGYALYVRSDSYRLSRAQALSEALKFPSEIGGVAPRSVRSRQFNDLRIWMPDRTGLALSCNTAIVHSTPQPDDPEAYEIELRGGNCEVSRRTWLRADYRALLESGLRPGFDPDGPRRVRFSHMDLTIAHERFQARLSNAAGQVSFVDLTQGRATAACLELNGRPTVEPVFFQSVFSPTVKGVRIDEFSIRVPAVPLAALNLEPLLHSDIESGIFAGRVVYREVADHTEVSMSGRCQSLDLQELTRGLLDPPWRGRLPEVELVEFRVEDRLPAALEFRGAVTDVVPGDILALWNLHGIEGKLTMHVIRARMTRHGIEHLSATGRCDGISLNALSESMGLGRMSGRLQVVLDDLTIRQNRLASLKASISIADGESNANWIEGELLRELVRRSLKISLPPVLPERIEFTQLGLRIDVQDEVMHIFGSHGPKERTILTVRLMGQPLPLISEPDFPIPLERWLQPARQRLATELELRFGAATQPAQSANQ